MHPSELSSGAFWRGTSRGEGTSTDLLKTEDNGKAPSEDSSMQDTCCPRDDGAEPMLLLAVFAALYSFE